MAVHMTYKPASAARATLKKAAQKGTSSVSLLATPFQCKMVELVEASNEDAALKIAKPPKGCIPTVYQLDGTVQCEGVGLHGAETGQISGNLFLLIYP